MEDVNLYEYLLYVSQHTLASPLLKSYVKSKFAAAGIVSYFDDLMPAEHKDSNNVIEAINCNMIELTSEIMRCYGPDIYEDKKYIRSIYLLENIIVSHKKELEFNITRLLYHLLCDTVAVSRDNILWYCQDGIWKNCHSDAFLWKYITHELMQFLMCEGAIDAAQSLKRISTRANIMRDVKLQLLDDNIDLLLDSKRDIICFRNGVFETNTGILRYAVPGDYVSVTTRTSLYSCVGLKNEVDILISILKTIFPDNDVFEFFMQSCALFLEGFNTNKLLFVWWGSGNNAKTLVQRLVNVTLGEYCNTAPTSLITGKRSSSSSATPDLCHVEKRLVVFLQEPNPEEKVQAGMVKELTGNDSLYTRQLFTSAKSINLKAKIVLVCNNILEIPGMDAALRRRIVVIPFYSTFLSDREYQKRQEKGTLDKNCQIINSEIEDKLLKCKSAFLYLLCKRFIEIKDKPLMIPQRIQECTEYYLNKHQYPLTFIIQFVRPMPGSHVAISDIYEMFKEWFKRAYPNKKVVDFESFNITLTDEGYHESENGVIMNIYVSFNGDVHYGYGS